MKPTSQIGLISQHLDRELITVDENSNNSTENSFDIPERPENGGSRRKSIVTVIPNERILPYENPKISEEFIQSNAASSKRLESLYQTPNHSAHHSPILNSPSKRNSRCNSRDLVSNRIVDIITLCFFLCMNDNFNSNSNLRVSSTDS